MRVIAGSAKGRKLQAPKSDHVRPTADRVREAMFDVLMSLDVVRGATVLDLFAGSGALGIEAASRGAETVTFVDEDRRVAAVITANIAGTGLANSVTTHVVVSDAMDFLQLRRPRVDVALIDPPYRFTEWEKLLDNLDAEVVVCESDQPVSLPDRYVLHRVYRYGTTLVTVATPKSDGVAVDAS